MKGDSASSWEMKLLSSSATATASTMAASSTAPASSSSGGATGLATSQTIVVDVQDFSSVTCPTIVETSISPPRSPTAFRYHRHSSPCDTPASESSAMIAAVAAAAPSEKPRKLSRGSSIKSLFSGGSKPPKTTPTCLSPTGGSPKRSMSAASPSRSPGPHNANKQFLQVGNPSSIFRLPKPQVKLLKKTASVKQLYNSVLHALKTISMAKTDDITPELTKRFFENILRASDDNPRLVVTKVKVKDAKEFGRHFCSEVHAVEVTAKDKDSCTTAEDESNVGPAGNDGWSPDGQKVYHLIVKSQPTNEDARKFLQPGHTFEKEVQMYGQVFHDMANFVRRESVISLNCKDSEVIEVPRCYYTRWAGDDNMKEDLIILENLYPQGFTFALEQDAGLDRAHSELVIRELAKFHAISFCMKQGNNASLLERYACLAEDSLYRESTEGFTKRTITPVMASLAELLRNTPDYEEHYDWFVELARSFHAIQMEMVRPRNQFAVICHGDLWLSNILFKYASAGQAAGGGAASAGGGAASPHLLGDDDPPIKPMEVKFIDFQSARFASLATDLILFLFTSVKTELRRTMLGELISLYYTTFLVSVRSLNVAEDIFSMEELFIEIEELIIYGFLEGIWYLDIVHSGHVPKTGSSGIKEESARDLEEPGSKDEDAFEEGEVKRLEQEIARAGESQEERDYKDEFFELLDEGRNSFGGSIGAGAERGGGGQASSGSSPNPSVSDDHQPK